MVVCKGSDRIARFPEEISMAEANSVYSGVTRLSLMENAGVAVANTVRRFAVAPSRVAVVCGAGNNGGDGLVAARYLLKDGYDVTVLLLSGPSEIRTEEAKTNWEEFRKLDGRYVDTTARDFQTRLANELKAADIIVDAIFGTGISGEIGGLPATVIREINESGKTIVAVDTPSGLDPFSGTIAGIAVKANCTVTFHINKKGLVEHPEHSGAIEVVDIHIPVTSNFFIGEADLGATLRPRFAFSHKGDFGTVLTIGGSSLYHGAPALAALAALRTGCGLSIIAAPEIVAPSIRAVSPDLIVMPLPGTALRLEHLDLLRPQLDKASVLAIGPGLGKEAPTLQAAIAILELAIYSGRSIVLDADAIDVINRTELSKPERVVITPHAGEFERIAGTRPGPVWRDRIGPVRDFSLRRKCTTLLKGHHTVISDGKRIRVYAGGNPGMAKGGVGDVLTGVISGLISQGNEVFDSACAGAYTLGASGDNLLRKMGFHFVASDLICELPEIMRCHSKSFEE